MQESREERVVLESLEHRGCDEAQLVLTAKNIPSRIDRGDGGNWRVLVPVERSRAARSELAAYAGELRRREAPPGAVQAIASGWPGVVVFVMVLLAIATAVRQDLFGFDWLTAGELDATRVQQGEWWRSVTALTVHLDLDHLLGNLFFGGFFGHFVARYLGEGIGWAAIVAAGALGNWVNAWAHPAGDRSIGASTAVFAALGILTALSWRRGVFRRAPLRTRLAPIVAGVALLAYTGAGGEHTDVFAHLAGFAAGFMAGLALARLQLPVSRRAQFTAGAAAVAVLVLCWMLAWAEA